LTTDELCIEVIARGYVTVDAKLGVAYSARFWGKKLGSVNTGGYIVCTLHCDGVRKQIKLHRLIWISVYGIPPKGKMPDHKNRVKSDNRISNLRLVDSKGNAENRRTYRGEQNPAARINRLLAEKIRKRHAQLKSYTKTAAEFGVSRSLVAQIVRNELWVERTVSPPKTAHKGCKRDYEAF
jgi:HNH endonuclease